MFSCQVIFYNITVLPLHVILLLNFVPMFYHQEEVMAFYILPRTEQPSTLSDILSSWQLPFYARYAHSFEFSIHRGKKSAWRDSWLSFTVQKNYRGRKITGNQTAFFAKLFVVCKLLFGCQKSDQSVVCCGIFIIKFGFCLRRAGVSPHGCLPLNQQK